MPNAAKLDENLVAGLKIAKSKRAYFALVLKGSTDGALIISKSKVPPADIAEAKKKSGGSALLKGHCLYEDGTYVFETAKAAPATAAQAVKTIAKRDAGLTLKAEFRVGADPELLADEGGSPGQPVSAAPTAQPKDGAPPQNGAELTKRLNAMAADIKAALAGPNKARVQAQFVAVSGQIKNNDFAQATKGLDELALLVSQDGSAPKESGAAGLQSAAQSWQAARQAVQGELTKLQIAILKAYQPTLPKDKLADLANATKQLHNIMDKLDDRLVKTLDEARNAKTPDALKKLATSIVKQYRSFVDSDPLVGMLDDNPFTPVSVRGRLIQALADVDKKLA
jgi:hypothetical protein